MADGQDSKIDELQNELIVAILSYLSVKEAAKTCLVSRRWRYLWQYTTGCLEIYDWDKTSISPEVARSFMNLVNHALELHQGPTLDQFRVGFCYSSGRFILDHWVKFAIQKEVKLFELNLAVDCWEHCKGWSRCNFPDIERLSSCKLKFSRFCSNLKSLTIVNVNVKDEIIHFFLSNCPCLEQVRISASGGLQNLRVTRPLPSLKSMEISRCSFVKVLEVDASNLASFTYIGPNIEMPFRNVPQLADLTIGGGYSYCFMFNVDKHTSYSSKLRKLKLVVPPEVMLNYPDDLPVLDNLRELELDLELEAGRKIHYFTFLAEVAPLLSSFTARMTYTGILHEEILSYRHRSEYTPLLADDPFVHKHLKVVKLIGFTGCSSDFELALHLLQIGVSLEKIILQLTYSDLHCEISLMALIPEQIKQLEAKLRPEVKLLML